MESYSVQAVLSAKDSNFTSTFSKAGGLLSSFSNATSSITFGALTAAGTAAFNTITGAIGGAVTSAYSVGSSFDTATSQIAATMGKSKDEISDVIAEAQRLGSTTKFTATEAAEGMNFLAMAGLTAEEQIKSAENVLNLASAGAYDMDTAASQIVGTLKGFGYDAAGQMEVMVDGQNQLVDSSQRAADVIAKGATMANTDVAALGEALSSSAATASSYGQSLDGTSVALLRLAEQNVTGAEASTALNRAMADLFTPTDTAAAALEELGISAYDSSGKARDFNDVVDDLDSALAGMSDEEANAYKSTIFTTHGLSAFNKMTASSTEKVEEFKDGIASASDTIGDDMGSAASQAHTQLDNIEGDVALLGSAWDGFALGIWDKVREPARGVVQTITGMLGNATEAITNSDLIDTLVSQFASAIKWFGDNLPKILDSLSPIADGIATFGGKVVDVLAGIGKGFGEDGLKGAISSLANSLTDLVTDAVSSASGIVGGIATAISDGLPDLIDTGADIITTINDSIVDNIDDITESFTSLVEDIAGVFSGTDAITEVATSAASMVGAVASSIAGKLPRLILAGGYMLLALVQGIAAGIPVIAQAAADTVTSFWNGLSSEGTLSKILNTGIDIIASLITGIFNGVTTLVENIPTIFGAVGEAITSVNWLEVGATVINKIGGAILEGIVGLIKAIGEALGECTDMIVEALSESVADKTYDQGYEAGKSFADGYANFDYSYAREMAAEGVSFDAQGRPHREGIEYALGIVDAIYEKEPDLELAGEGAGEAVADGVDSSGEKVEAAAGESAESILNKYKDKNGEFNLAGSESVNAVADGISGNTDTALESLGILQTSMTEQLADSYEDVTDATTTALGGTTDAMKAMKEELNETAGELASEMATNLADEDSAASAGTTTIETYEDSLNAAVSAVDIDTGGLLEDTEGADSSGTTTGGSFVDAVGVMANDLPGVITSALDLVTAAAGSQMQKFAGTLETSAKTAIDKLRNTLDKMAKTVTPSFTKLVTLAKTKMTLFRTTIQAQVLMATAAMQTSMLAIAATVTAGITSVATNAASGMSKFTQAIQAGGSSAAQAMASAATAIKSNANLSGLRSIASSGMNAYTNGITSGSAAAVTAAGSAARKVVATLGSYDKSARQAGRSIGENFRAGMADMLSAVIAQAAELARRAVEAIRRQAQVSSSSGASGSRVVTPNFATIDNAAISVGAIAYSPQSASAGGAKASTYSFEIPVTIDGREVARATAYFTQDELNKLERRNNRRLGHV